MLSIFLSGGKYLRKTTAPLCEDPDYGSADVQQSLHPAKSTTGGHTAPNLTVFEGRLGLTEFVGAATFSRMELPHLSADGSKDSLVLFHLEPVSEPSGIPKLEKVIFVSLLVPDGPAAGHVLPAKQMDSDIPQHLQRERKW